MPSGGFCHQRAIIYVNAMEDKKEERKYRYTKQLVRIALEQGYKPEDILQKAGLSPKSTSLLSRWKNGKAQATRRQLQYFINDYEHLLKRKIEHLFYGTVDNKLTFRKLTGEVVLKHVVRYPLTQGKRNFSVALFRIVLLKEGSRYHIVHQARAGLSSNSAFNASNDLNKLIHSNNEDANWFAYEYQIAIPVKDVLEGMNNFIHKLGSGDNLAGLKFSLEWIALSYIVRQTLLKQGYQCQDIIDLTTDKETIT